MGSFVLMDQKEFGSDSYQRVYQYIRRHMNYENLDAFSYAGILEGSPHDCLDLLLRYRFIVHVA